MDDLQLNFKHHMGPKTRQESHILLFGCLFLVDSDSDHIDDMWENS